jgi:hypothetical protein
MRLDCPLALPCRLGEEGNEGLARQRQGLADAILRSSGVVAEH